MDVIDRLHAAVRDSKIPKKKIAHDAGMSASKLSRLLNHQLKNPSIHDIEAVLAAMGRTMQSLYAGTSDGDVREALRTLTEYVDRHEARSPVKPKPPTARSARPFPVAADPNVVLLDERKYPRQRIPRELWARGAQYAAKAVGDSMTGIGIENGDTVFFRHAQRAKSGDVIIIRVNTAVYLKRYEIVGRERHLVSENPAYRDIVIQPADDHELYGIVVFPEA